MLNLAEQALLPGARSLTPPEVWTAAGVDEALARRLWLAMGFPTAPDEVPAFGEADVEALRTAAGMLNARVMAGAGDDLVVQQARVMARAIATVAASHAEVIGPLLSDPDLSDIAVATQELPRVERLLGYMYRRHLLDAIRRLQVGPSGDDDGAGVAVGFADLVGFTAAANEMTEAELASLVDSFTALAADTVAARAGRVVKVIGDEVMFAVAGPRAAADTALELVARLPAAAGMDLRVGLAWGPVIQREGDLFGPTVNLASRLTGIARPGTILVDEALGDALGEEPDLDVHWLRRHNLKGFGRVRAAALRSLEGA